MLKRFNPPMSVKAVRAAQKLRQAMQHGDAKTVNDLTLYLVGWPVDDNARGFHAVYGSAVAVDNGDAYLDIIAAKIERDRAARKPLAPYLAALEAAWLMGVVVEARPVEGRSYAAGSDVAAVAEEVAATLTAFRPLGLLNRESDFTVFGQTRKLLNGIRASERRRAALAKRNAERARPGSSDDDSEREADIA
jgi:hypothetical protein